MKTAKIAMLAGLSGSLLLASSAEAVITGVTVVPVSFEQGWLAENGALISSGTSTTAVENDAVQHGRTAAAWVGSLSGYKTFRVYLTTDTAGTGVNGQAGNDVSQIDMIHETRLKDDSGPGSAFFNYMTGTANQASTAGPQAYGSASNNANGQRAYDSYLTVLGASAGTNAGAAIEGVPSMFNGVRGRTGVAATIQTGDVGNGFDASTSIDCQNCGFLATLPVLPIAYSYNSAASLAANAGAPIEGLGVLIGQFTVKATDGIRGQILAVGTGTDTSFIFEYSANIGIIPAPGALALLGVAGAVGRRRRRS